MSALEHTYVSPLYLYNFVKEVDNYFVLRDTPLPCKDRADQISDATDQLLAKTRALRPVLVNCLLRTAKRREADDPALLNEILREHYSVYPAPKDDEDRQWLEVLLERSYHGRKAVAAAAALDAAGPGLEQVGPQSPSDRKRAPPVESNKNLSTDEIIEIIDEPETVTPKRPLPVSSTFAPRKRYAFTGPYNRKYSNPYNRL